MGYGMLGDLLGVPPIKRRVFVSYHHQGDRSYYDAFSRQFAENYDVVHDSSVERVIGSNNAEYVIRKIRESYISGSSCTVVLCGGQTPGRKFVDWEIKATLDKEHGLIGVNLPTNPTQQNGAVLVPDRLHDNVASGYAIWLQWNEVVLYPTHLAAYIEEANGRSKDRIRNMRALVSRNT